MISLYVFESDNILSSRYSSTNFSHQLKVFSLKLRKLGNFTCLFSLLIFSKINIFKKFFHKYHQSVEKFGI